MKGSPEEVSEVNGIQIIGLLRDWHPGDAVKYEWVPKVPIIVCDIPLWPHKQAMAYMTQRVREHQAAAAQDDDSLPLCSPEDRWQSTDTWKVKKEGGKMAVKGGVFTGDTAKQEAQALAVELSSGSKVPYLIENTPSIAKRCAEYCEVWAFCEFGRKVRAELVDKQAETN